MSIDTTALQSQTLLVNPFLSRPEGQQVTAARPGVSPLQSGDRVDLTSAGSLPADASCAPATSSLSLGKRVALATVALISVGTPLSNTWAAALQAPSETSVSTTLAPLQTAPNPTVGYVKPGTARITLASKADGWKGPQAVTGDNGLDMGVNLGHHLFLDSHGTLSLVTQEGGEIREFQQLKNETGVPDADLKAVRAEGVVRVTGPHGTRRNYAEFSNGVTIRSHEGPYAVRAGGDSTFIVGGPGVAERYRITWQDDTASITLPNSETLKVTVAADHATVVDTHGEMRTYPMTTRATLAADAQIKLDSEVHATAAENAIQTLETKLDELEPGYVKQHPVSAALMQFMLRDADTKDLLEVKARLNGLEVASEVSATVSAVHTGIALVGRSTALGLASNAMALKGQALAAQSAAMSAAHSGQLAQAGQLAHQAGSLGAQAKATGAQAMHVGEGARAAAQIGKIAIGVSGALAVVDGALQAYHGFESLETIEQARSLATVTLQRVAEEESPETYQAARADFENVVKTLDKLHEYQEGNITIGGIKMTCGGLMIVSAFAGGVLFPPVIGAVGSMCYIGTAIYEHYRDK